MSDLRPRCFRSKLEAFEYGERFLPDQVARVVVPYRDGFMVVVA